MNNSEDNIIPLSTSSERLINLLRCRAGSGNNIDDEESYTETGLLSTTLSEDAEARDAIAIWILAQQEHNQSVENALTVLKDKIVKEDDQKLKSFKLQHFFNISILLILCIITGKILLIDNLTDRLWDSLSRVYDSEPMQDKRFDNFIKPD